MSFGKGATNTTAEVYFTRGLRHRRMLRQPTLRRRNQRSQLQRKILSPLKSGAKTFRKILTANGLAAPQGLGTPRERGLLGRVPHSGCPLSGASRAKQTLSST